MSFEFDREVDALLRRHAGGGAERVRDRAATTPAAGHLDADELSAYAENALPDAARARYFSHLADCDKCRRAVTTLALVAGVPGELERHAPATKIIASPVTAVPVASWRERLSTWLMPGATQWRYVLPLVALLVVSGVVMWSALRNQRKNEVAQSTAQRVEKNAASPPETHHAPSPAAPQQELDGTSADGVAESQPKKSAQPAEDLAQNKEPAKSVMTDRADLAAEAPPLVTPAPGAGVAASSGEAPPPPAATPAPVSENITITKQAEAKPTDTQERARAEESQYRGLANVQRNARDLQLNETQQNAAQNRANVEITDESVGRRGRDDTAASESANAGRQQSRPPGSAAAKRSARAAPAEKRDMEREKKEKSSKDSEREVEETRSVAGRRFRRQGGVWIDTAYKTSQATVIVKRGSEQFRALVADSPALRTVAGAFGGDVVVVWQGRAYRIR
ncbi:MAG: zf-HC2 domain-containing protein [Pyrinomonadaceae bacterium]